MVYQAVTVAKLTYEASAWCGFTSAVDRQRLEAVSPTRQTFWRPRDQPAIAELVDFADC